MAFVLLPTLVAIFTFGSMIHLEIAEQAAAAAGARAAGSAGGFSQPEFAAVNDELAANGVDTNGCAVTATSNQVPLGQPIAVTVSCPQHIGIPFLLEEDLNLQSTFVARGEVNR